MRYKKYDLHTHTRFSRCSDIEPAELLRVAKERGLDGIAVADHDTIKGALAVKKLNKDKDFEVVIAEEVSTDIGHVLVYFVKQRISPGKVERVVRDAKRQRAVVVLAHPFNILTDKLGRLVRYKERRMSMSDESKIGLFDGIEVMNARCLMRKENQKAYDLAKKHKKIMTAGSDSHFLKEVGKAYIKVRADKSLRVGLKDKVTIGGRQSGALYYRVKSLVRKHT
ncbi:PHP domain-containing protein [Nanoarchaeota archaeon]